MFTKSLVPLLSLLLTGIVSAQAWAYGAFFTVSQTTLKPYKDVSLPVFSRDGTLSAQKINTHVQQFVTNFIQEKRESYQEDITVNATYAITYNNSNYLSMVFTFTYGLEGWPQYAAQGLTFRSDNGNLVRANDLNIRPQEIAKALFRQARAENVTLKKDLRLRTVPENFYFDKNCHLHFLFAKGEVATEASGAIDLLMPADETWTNLSDERSF